ncbi:MAG: hypothetical protein ACJ74Y_09970, partial [Bryobacteraceae bacterium]
TPAMRLNLSLVKAVQIVFTEVPASRPPLHLRRLSDTVPCVGRKLKSPPVLPQQEMLPDESMSFVVIEQSRILEISRFCLATLLLTSAEDRALRGRNSSAD